MKRMILAVILASLSLSVRALEPMSDDSMAAAVGQSGLTVDVGAVNVSASHLRYADSDGFTGYTNPGALDIANLDISKPSNTLITLDIGSTGVGPAAKSGLLLGIGPISGMSITTGDISADNGSELVLGSSASTHTFAQVSLTNIDVSAISLLITPGGQTSSGFSVTTMAPISMSADLMLKDMVNGGTITSKLAVSNYQLGNATFDVTNAGIAVGINSGSVDAVRFDNLRLGANQPGAEVGGIGLLNANFSNTTMMISGH